MLKSGILGLHAKACVMFLFLFLFALTLVSSSLVESDSASAESTSNYSFGSHYLSITSSGDLGITLVPSLSGTLRSAKDSLLIKTDVPTGYSLYLSTSSSMNNSNRLFRNNDSTGASGYIEPSTNPSTAPSSLAIDTWGFAVPNNSTGAVITNFDASYSAPTPSSTSKWAAVPTIATPTKIQETTTANTSGVNLDVYYAVKADTALATGNYSNTVIYSAVTDPTPGAATLSPTTGGPGDTITINTSFAVTLPVNALGLITTTMNGQLCTDQVLSKDSNNYLQITCKVPNSLTTGSYTATVSIPKFGQTYTTSNQYNLVVSFAKAYANAGKTQVTIGSNQYYKMQDMTAAICNAVTTAASPTATQTETLADIRDNKTYTVAKLKSNPSGTEGNCWMTENLRLGSASASTTLTSASSNVTSNFTLPMRTTSQSWPSTYTASWFYPSNAQNTNTSNGALGYYGYYYNYYAATAGTVTNTLTNATADICPKGWSLPPNYRNAVTGNTSTNYKKSYSALLYAYGIISPMNTTGTTYANSNGFNIISAAPLKFVLSGYHDNSGTSVIGRGARGYNWSSYSSNATYAYRLNFSPNGISPQGDGTKDYGRAMCCVAK